MTLEELSKIYTTQGDILGQRIAQVAGMRVSPEDQFTHQRRLKLLRDMQRESRELAKLTAHYYERGFQKRGKYAL